jgi:hypothetical protein
MIRNKLYLLFAFFLMINFISCDDEPLENPTNPAQDGDDGSDLNAVFEATLSDTINFSATEIAAELTDDGLQFSGTMNNERIGFSVTNPTVGSKDFSSGDVDGFYDSDIEELISDFYTAQQGVLNIQSIDSINNMISGTFNGEFQEITSNDSISITEGVFTDIIFQDNTSSTGQGGDGDTTEVSGGSLIVDIDGETNTFDLEENNFPDDQDVAVYSFIKLDEDNPQDSTTITLVLPSNVTQGSSDVNNFADSSSLFNPYSLRYDNLAENLIVLSVQGSGQININTVNDTTIEGTFNLDAEDIPGSQTLSFTNGSFTIELVE